MPFNETHQGATRHADPLTLAYIKRLEDALQVISQMHDTNPSPIANPEPLDYARSVMRDMRNVAREALNDA